MPDLFDSIMADDYRAREPELQRIFRSITTEDLNGPVRWNSGSTLLIGLLCCFDIRNRYPYLVLSLFDSPLVEPSLLHVNEANVESGATPLMYTARRGQLELSQKLLSLGARPDIMVSRGVTPIWVACSKGHVEIFKLLAPLAPSNHFIIVRPRSPLFIRDEVTGELSKSANHAQLQRLIDAELARRGLV